MVEATQKSQLKRKSKPFPLIGLIRCNNKKELGSGATSPTIRNSMNRSNDPYMPNIQHHLSSTSLPTKRHQHPAHRNTNSSTPHLVTQPHRQPVTPSPESPQHIHHHHYYFNSPTTEGFENVYNVTTTNQQSFYKLNRQNSSNSQLPPLSPPPLSPTNLSFATTARPSWRDMARSPTYQPASSISSSDLDDDDDEPIGLLLSSKTFSLLSETSEDGDDELIPIAHLSNTHCLSAAEKYKAKVRAKFQMTTDNGVSF